MQLRSTSQDHLKENPPLSCQRLGSHGVEENHRWLSATFSLQNDLFLESTWKLVCNMSSSHDISFSDCMTCSRTKSQLKQKCLSCQVMPSDRWRKSVNSTNVISLANDIMSCGNISYHRILSSIYHIII